jgi:hypothetical protein
VHEVIRIPMLKNQTHSNQSNYKLALQLRGFPSYVTEVVIYDANAKCFITNGSHTYH